MKKWITKNFMVKEIFGKVPWEKVPRKSQYIAEHLCKYILQPIRDKRPEVIIDINSGCRITEDLIRILKQGYNPSPTTDHFFGVPQKIPPSTPKNRAKIKKYGPWYTYSTGAVNMAPRIPQNQFEAYFEWLVDLDRMGIIDAGQIILEKGKYTWWIHISVPVSVIYNIWFIKAMGLQKHKYLKSINNGKTYTIYNPGKK